MADITWRTLEGAWIYASDPLLSSTGAKFNGNTIIVIDNTEAYNITKFKLETNFVAKHYFYCSFGVVFNYNTGVSGAADTYFSLYFNRRYVYLKKHTADGLTTEIINHYTRIYLNTNHLYKLTVTYNAAGNNRVTMMLDDSIPLLTYDNLDTSDVGAVGSLGLVAITDGNVIYDNVSVYTV